MITSIFLNIEKSFGYLGLILVILCLYIYTLQASFTSQSQKFNKNILLKRVNSNLLLPSYLNLIVTRFFIPPFFIFFTQKILIINSNTFYNYFSEISILGISLTLLIILYNKYIHYITDENITFYSLICGVIILISSYLTSLLDYFIFLEFINLLLFGILLTSMVEHQTGFSAKTSLLLRHISSQNYQSKVYAVYLYFWLGFLFSIGFYGFIYLTNSSNVLNVSNIESMLYYSRLTSIFVKGSKGVMKLANILLFFTIIVKLGLPPIFFLKLEIYKSISLYKSILFSIISLAIYYPLLNNLFNILTCESLLTHIITGGVLCMILILVFQLFYETNIKGFFAISTIINILFITLISLII